MKIPETSANVGAYYGNEESGQWQPNGVIIDSGVGGGVVGSGDAGIHRPVYPVHIPRGHIPGYVMAGAYYPPAYPAPPAPAPPPDFEDYMWMENEEEFDKQVMQQLEEEALMEQCIEAMLEDEQREARQRPTRNGHPHHYPTTSNGNPSLSLEEAVSRSTLNPLAAEFVPTRVRQPPPPQPPAHKTEEKHESPSEVLPTQEHTAREEEPQHSAPAESAPVEDSKTEEPPKPHTDPPEVSAADVQPIDKRPKDTKKPETKKQEVKKPLKQEPKKVKPLTVKSDTRMPVKKKDVKSVKSEIAVDDKDEELPEVVEPLKLQPSQIEEITTGPKPINYAAAAKANKPKKPSTPITTTTEKQPTIRTAEKKSSDRIDRKPKPEKPIQRKNSAK